MSETGFKRCPFCQSLGVHLIQDHQQVGDDVEVIYAFECKACHAIGPFAHTEAGAELMWNERRSLEEAKEQAH